MSHLKDIQAQMRLCFMTTIMVLPTRFRPLGNAQAKMIVEGVFSQIAEVTMAGGKREKTITLDNS
ncbi:hypothetical protein AOG23_29595 [Rhizobium acidisoli]|nr:hypothetical protein AOG23_29595 [Rhizobium acidisoli]